jgi:type I restriction enzyme S subunit
MTWQQLQLGDVVRLKRGHDLPTSERLPGDVPIVSSSGVTGFHNVAKVAGPGVVTGRYGTLGEVHYIEEDYWPLNTALYVEDFKGSHPRFVAYLLKTLDLGNQNAAGAVPGVNRNALHQIRVTIPALDAQRRIARVLEAYDDLIGTNQRRVALLEDAARRMYREWFVSLRFPGHELVPLKDELPQGWRRLPLGELCDQTPGASVQTGPFGSQLHQSDYKPTGVPVVMPQDIVADRIRHDRIAHVDESMASRLSRHALRALDIVFPRRGDISKRALVEQHQAGFLCGTGCLKISLPLQPLHPLVLYFQLADPEMVKWIEGQAVGATMLNLSASIMRTVPCLVPTYSVQEQFVDTVGSMRAQIDTLGAQVESLSKARDLLLPKLVSGKLDVSSIRLPEEATI